MSRRSGLCLLAALATAGALAPPSLATAPKAAQAGARIPLVPRQLASLARYPFTLVQLDSGAGERAERILRAAGAVEIAPRIRAWRLRSDAAGRLAPRLALAGLLREVQPDRPQAELEEGGEADPLSPSEWWLARVGADRAAPPGPGVPITIIDSGLDLTHPEFAGRPDTVALNAQRLVGADDVHGTAVSSMIAAPVNGLGLVGVYPRAVLRSWDVTPEGQVTTGDVVAGLAAAASLGPGIVNLSLGGGFRDPIEEDAVLDAFERGVVVVASAGNGRERGSPATFPGGLPHVLTVASTGQTDQVSPFSTRSRAVDLAAPGEHVPAAVPVSLDATGYMLVDGTSFSAPIVAGAAAWVWTARPTLDKTQLSEVIRRSARDVGLPGRDPDTGFGVLDIPAALAAEAPLRDPYEPNDDIRQVKANTLFARAKPLLTNPLRGRATLRARLDGAEDPEDVYRIWVPAHSRISVAVTSNRDVDVEVWASTTFTVLEAGASRSRNLLAEGLRRGAGRRTATYLNSGSRGFVAYVDVFLRADATFGDAVYELSIRSPRDSG